MFDGPVFGHCDLVFRRNCPVVETPNIAPGQGAQFRRQINGDLRGLNRLRAEPGQREAYVIRGAIVVEQGLRLLWVNGKALPVPGHHDGLQKRLARCLFAHLGQRNSLLWHIGAKIDQPGHNAWVHGSSGCDGIAAHRMTDQYRWPVAGIDDGARVGLQCHAPNRCLVLAMSGKIDGPRMVPHALQQRDHRAPAPRAMGRAMNEKDIRHARLRHARRRAGNR